ncbi:hypothetical protein SLEP1_g46857 [Rubroshorea leprosula]|uniref:Uncharacterized protein n=1 Tax=Rubroshorea leprosula TaxID=152421 RepID=A0AAV5LNM2_9ROSI|nr:hypothetical protein SLEP1_g46857 [Rubroshorea leprosula]
MGKLCCGGSSDDGGLDPKVLVLVLVFIYLAAMVCCLPRPRPSCFVVHQFHCRICWRLNCRC